MAVFELFLQRLRFLENGTNKIVKKMSINFAENFLMNFFFSINSNFYKNKNNKVFINNFMSFFSLNKLKIMATIAANGYV